MMPAPKITSSRKREPLTRERIVLAALELVERDGLDGFSFRKLASDLKCEAMSIYYHYPSKAHLFDSMVGQCLRYVDWPTNEDSWLAALRHGFVEFRRIAHRHPAFFHFMALYRMNSPDGLCMLEMVLGIFRRAGFSPEQSARYFRMLSYYIVGAALDETSGYAKGPSAAEPVPDEVVARDYPTVASVGPFFKPETFDETFFAGLDLLLDGIEKAHKALPKPHV